jgi:hypothetical protein
VLRNTNSAVALYTLEVLVFCSYAVQIHSGITRGSDVVVVNLTYPVLVRSRIVRSRKITGARRLVSGKHIERRRIDVDRTTVCQLKAVGI